MADYTTLKAAIASVIKTNGNQEITGLLLQQTLHSMLDGVNTTKQDTINFVINTANKFLRDDGTFQEIQSPAGGFANNLYFTDIDSVVVSGYKTLSYNPDAGAINLNASVTAAEGVKTVQNYLYPSGVSVDLFPSGLWSFNFYAYLDLNVGNTQIGVQYFKRSVAGVETNLFTAWSAEINNTTPLWIKFETTNPSFIVDPTDRMGARILVKTTSTPAVNLTIAIGDGYAAYLNNPNRIRHSQLRDWNGDPNYLHITQTEKTNFQTAYTDRFKWDGGSSGLNAVTGRESLGLRIGIDVLAYRTFGSAANNNTNDFLAYNGVAVDSSKLGGQLPSYYQTNITAGTSLQYYRGDKTMQTLDTSVVPENSNMYFTYPRVLATALTGYAAGANTALSASDTILAAMGKIQGQINARALASDLSGHINNTTIHLTADEKTYLGKIMTYLKVAVDNTSMYSTINFYSESGVSAYGIGTGGGGGAGVDIIDDLLSVRTDAALSANQGRILKGFVDLKQPKLTGTGASSLVRVNTLGTIIYDDASYALTSALHNAVSIGTANGLSLSTQVLSLSLASTSVAGAMSAADKSKLDGIAANANNYSLPTATASVLGGVKIGTNVDIVSGVISVHNPVTLGTANGLSLSTQALSLALATTSTNGAMSSTQFNKLAGIADNANNYVHPTTSGNKHIPSGGIAGNILKWSADGTAVWGAEYSYSLPLAASGTRGGIQIGYTASGANLPLLLSSEKAYIALTKSAIESVLSSGVSLGTILLSSVTHEAPIIDRFSGVSGSGVALARIRNNDYDIGLGMSLSGNLITGLWSDINTLSTSWKVIYHSATPLTTYTVGSNTAISAGDTILSAFGKAQGQINARALSTDLTAHINNTSPHLSADERTYFNKLKLYLKIAADNTSMYSTLNFYSESGVSAFGIGSGGGGSVGVDIIDDLLSVRTDAALSANQGRILKGFVDLKQPQLNGTGLVRMSGTSVSYDNTSYATSASLLSHTGNTSNPHSVTAAQVSAVALSGTPLTTGLDLNTLTNVGSWFTTGTAIDNSLVNRPTAGAGESYVTNRLANGLLEQIFTELNGYEKFVRAYRGTWSAWYKFYHSGNLLNIGTTASSARTALGLGTMATETASNYLSVVANQTVTGQKTFNTGGYAPVIIDRTGAYTNTNILFRQNGASDRYLGYDNNFDLRWGDNPDSSLNYKIYHSGNLLNIGTTAFSARTALGLGSMALETASNYLTTATAASTYLPLIGGIVTMSAAGSMVFKKTSNNLSVIAFEGLINSSNTRLGYLGFNGVNSPVFVDSTGSTAYNLYHSGNSNTSSVAWAASTFTEGGVSLASKYLGISAKATDSDKLDGYDYTAFGGYVGGVTDIHAIGGQNLYTFFSSASTPTNSPSATTFIQGIQFAAANNNAYRQIIVSDGSSLYWESQWNGTWSGWRKIWDSSNLLNIGTTASSARTALELTGTVSTHNHNGTYALLAGSTSQAFSVSSLTMNGVLSGATTGSFSSTLSANRIVVTSTSNEKHLEFSRSDYNYIASNGHIGFITGGTVTGSANQQVWIHSNGNTKIGAGSTSEPAYTLDVNGTGRFTSNVNIEGGLNITGATGYSEGIRIKGVSGISSIWFNAINDSQYDPKMYGLTVDSTGLRFRYGTGSTPSDIASISNTGNITASSTIQATTAKLTNLTDGYIPYHISDASGLGNSIISQSGTGVKIIDAAAGNYAQVTSRIILGHLSADVGLIGYEDNTTEHLSIKANGGSSAIKLFAGNEERVRISANGYVGIGTTSAWAKLSIANTGSDTIPFFGVDGATYGWNFYIRQSDGNLLIKANNGSVLTDVLSFKRTNGNIGIGYTDRNEKFAVNGSGYFNSTLTAPTFNTGGSRPVNITSGGVTMQGDSGGWAMQYGFVGSSGTNRGGFGAYGGADGVEYFYVGHYSSGIAKFYPSGYVAISTSLTVPTVTATTSIKIGANWEAIPNGTYLELRYGGVMKAKLSSSGDILAVGGVTAFAV